LLLILSCLAYLKKENMSAPALNPSAPRRALIVIDVQNEYFSGQMRISYPDPQSSLQQIGRAMDAAHQAGIPIFLIGILRRKLPRCLPVAPKPGHCMTSLCNDRLMC
jgi:nicotinamidase-related amidase